MKNTFAAVIITPIGKLGLIINNAKLTGLQFLPVDTPILINKNSNANKIASIIEQYFHDPKIAFDVSIDAVGTPLQQKIWQELQRIPVGQTRTYGEVAKIVGTSPRIVGNACRCNPIPLVIPCHRVLSKAGLGGYFGVEQEHFLQIKRWLLAHENCSVVVPRRNNAAT